MSTLEACTDAELIARLREGEHAAFTEIYRRFWDKIFVVAYHRLQDQSDAEEVVQDVFYSLWKRRATLEIKYSLNTYLSAAVKYQVINKQSRNYIKAKELRTDSHAIEQGVDSTQLWFSERELKQQLELHIEQLPEKCRLVFKMSREQFLTNAQIATALGVSEKAVEAHITRALKILKDKLHISFPLLLSLLIK